MSIYDAIEKVDKLYKSMSSNELREYFESAHDQELEELFYHSGITFDYLNTMLLASCSFAQNTDSSLPFINTERVEKSLDNRTATFENDVYTSGGHIWKELRQAQVA